MLTNDQIHSIRAGFHSMCEYLLALPEDSPVREGLYPTDIGVSAPIYASSAEQFGKVCAALGSFKKDTTSHDLTACKSFFPADEYGWVRITAYIPKTATCEKKETGEVKPVLKVDRSDKDFVRRMAMLEEEFTSVVEEPVTEWVCPPSFLSLADEAK